MIGFNRLSNSVNVAGAVGLLILMVLIGWLTIPRANAAAQTKAASPKPGVSAAKVQDGKRIFETHRCIVCHGIEGQGSAQAGGPRIGPPPIPFSTFAEDVRNPSGTMPPYGKDSLPDSELAEVYVFLQSRPPPPQAEATPAGNAKNGELIYARYGCYECHGYQGQGSTKTGAPRIGPPPMPFEEFAKYIRHPTGSMPPYTDKVTSDSELADIYAFLKSRPIPPPAASIPLLNQ
ncbi:MAG: c-type cytochrome [Candidatus Acidiferrales bacterium]